MLLFTASQFSIAKKEGVSMSQKHLHKTQKSPFRTRKNAAQGQDMNLSAFESLDEETLDQVTGGKTSHHTGNQQGGQPTPTDPSSWQVVHTYRSIAPGEKMRISPDGKYYTIGNTVLPNGVAHLD
jgi:COMC family